MAVDDSYTKALLHMDGANGSTTFTDESGIVWTRAGNAQISTAQFKFTASGLFDGNGDYIEATPDANLVFGTSDFTVDFWIYLNALKNYSEIYESRFNDHQSSAGFVLLNASDGKFAVYTQGNFRLVTASAITAGGWHHVAFVRNGNLHKIYIDGTADVNTWTNAANFTNNTAIIGAEWTKSDGFVNGYIDEMRVSVGIARWTNDFTPPTAPYAPAGDMRIYGATLLTEIDPASAGKASGALILSEIMPASGSKISGAMLLVEMTASPNPFGIIHTTLQARSTAATLRTKRKTYATLNERSTALTLEERP